jgi:hypothetical protein
MDNYAQISKKRSDLKKAYSGENWSKKVTQMADNQVIAIWYKLKKEGKVV